MRIKLLSIKRGERNFFIKKILSHLNCKLKIFYNSNSIYIMCIIYSSTETNEKKIKWKPSRRPSEDKQFFFRTLNWRKRFVSWWYEESLSSVVLHNITLVYDVSFSGLYITENRFIKPKKKNQTKKSIGDFSLIYTQFFVCAFSDIQLKKVCINTTAPCERY